MKNINQMTMQEMLEVMVNSNNNSKTNVFKSKYKPGEEVYVAHFCNETSTALYSAIRQSYKFRPKRGIVKEVVFDNTEHPIKYKIVGMASNSFSEELVSDNADEAQYICDELNKPRI